MANLLPITGVVLVSDANRIRNSKFDCFVSYNIMVGSCNCDGYCDSSSFIFRLLRTFKFLVVVLDLGVFGVNDDEDDVDIVIML